MELEQFTDGNESLVNLDCEKNIIGAILMSPQAMNTIALKVLPDMFYSVNHRNIYEVCLGFFRKGKHFDINLVAFELETSYGDRNWKSEISLMIDFSVSSGVDQYIDVLNNLYRRRKLRAGASKISLDCLSIKDWDELISRSQKYLLQATTTQLENSISSYSLTNILVTAYHQISSNNSLEEYIPTGFYDLDALLHGLRRQEMSIIAGRPSMGKTAFAGQLAINVASEGKSVVIFSLEMSKEQLSKRFISIVSKIPLATIREGSMSEENYGKVVEAISTLTDYKITIVDVTGQDLAAIQTKIALLKMVQDIDLVVVDHIGLIKCNNTKNYVRELGEITFSLREMGKNLNCHVSLLSQLSRGIETRVNKRPSLADLRDSGEVEQNADIVMALYRDEYYNPDSVDLGVAEIITLKNRDGKTGVVKLGFNNSLTSFIDMRKKLW
ncbi:MAG: replicative DNA helicase [Planktothrix sp.]